MSGKIFQLVPFGWPQTVLSGEDGQQPSAQTEQGCIGDCRSRCRCGRTGAFKRSEAILVTVITVLLILSVTTRLRNADGAYMTLSDAPAAIARRWLGEAADVSASAMKAQNSSTMGAYTDLKDALFTTVVVEIATVGAILAGVAAVGLAVLHSCLAWHNLASDAKGRLVVLSIVMGLVVLRAVFANGPSRALVFATLRPGSCALVTNGNVVLYEVALLVFVYLNLSILYKNIAQEAALEDARHATGSKRSKDRAAAKHGRLRNAVLPRSPSSHRQLPQATRAHRLASSESDAGRLSATGTGTGTATGSSARPRVRPSPDTAGDKASVPRSPLEVQHIWLVPVGVFFIVIDSAIKPFSVQPWSSTASQVLVGAALVAIVFSGAVGWFNARHSFNRPIGGVCLRAVGCCVQESCSCEPAKDDQSGEEPSGVAGPDTRDVALHSGESPRTSSQTRRRQWQCTCPAWWPLNARGATTILSTLVFPVAVMAPYVVDVFLPHSCPQWLASGGGGMEAAANPPPPGSAWPQGLDASLENDRNIVMASLIKMLSMAVGSAAIAVILSGAIILDGQDELAARRRDAAKESAETLRRAIGYISHEARGPLNAAVLSLTLLEDAEEYVEEDAAKTTGSGDTPMSASGGGGGLSSERLLSDLATSIHASKRHLDDLLLWERAGSDEDMASSSNWAWNDPELTLMSYVDRAFRGSCDAEDIDFEVVPLLHLSRPPRKARSTDRAPFVTVDSLAAETAMAGLASSENTSDNATSRVASDGLLAATDRGVEGGAGAALAVRGLELFLDADRLLGVCTNAVSNCIKHTPGGGTGRIQVVCTVLTGKAASAIALGAPAKTPPDVQALLDAAPKRNGCLGKTKPAIVDAGADIAKPESDRQSQPGASSIKPASRREASLTEVAAAAGAAGTGVSNTEMIFSPPEQAVLQLEVRDNGNGISRQLLESGKLFQPFARLRQGDDSLRMASSGLGLAIIRSIVVDGLHGRVGLSSRVGKGTVFFARVPLWVRKPLTPDTTTVVSAIDAAAAISVSSRVVTSLTPVPPPTPVDDPAMPPLPKSPAMRVTRGRIPTAGAGAGAGAGVGSSGATAGSGGMPVDSAAPPTAETGRTRADRAARREQRLADREARVAAAAAAAAAVPGSAVEIPPATKSAKDDSRSRRAARAKKHSHRTEPRGKPLSALRAMSAAWKGKLAYVVDDERVNRTLLAALLRRWGFVVREFEDGAEAVAALLRATTSLTGAALSASLRNGASGDAVHASDAHGEAVEVTALPGSADRATAATGSASSTARSTGHSSAGSPAGSAGSPSGSAGAAVAGFEDKVTTMVATDAGSSAGDGIPDIMTLDVEMPRLNGFGVLRKRLVMVENYVSTGETGVAAQLATMPVIVVSGNARQSDKDKLREYGANTIMTKPVDPDLLAKSIQEALAGDQRKQA